MRDAEDRDAVIKFLAAAAIADCHPQTLERAIRRGELEPLRRGLGQRAPRYLRRDDVLAWALERRRLHSDE